MMNSRRFSKDLLVTTTRMNNYYKKMDVSAVNDSKSLILNNEVSGLYFIELGPMKDLYGPMKISTEQYPQDSFRDFTVGKFGLSKDISSRFAQHQSKKNGYGRWCNTIQLKWMILMSPSQLFKAESILAGLLKANNLKFDHVDEFGKSHDELICFDVAKEGKVKSIFKQVMGMFPSKEEELAKAIEDNKKMFEQELLAKENELKLRNEKAKTLRALHQLELYKLKHELSK